MPVLIESVERGSPADRAGVRAGDTLVSIDGNGINDVLDYRFYMAVERPALFLLRGGKPIEIKLQKGEYDDLGLEFETYLMDKQRTCKNKCVFCFVDQMPGGMRESLYFKDDDSRMSFLFGNYITLTNLTDEDIERIIRMHISPVNVSVHTTDPALRVEMMKNPRAGESLEYLGRLTRAGILVNAQLVLVPGMNDGAALEKTLTDLGALAPNLQSVACVPVGLTRHRQGLTELRGFDEAGARETIRIIHRFAERMQRLHHRRIAYPSDEFFLRAGWELPDAGYYGDFDQLENGVGLLALLKDEFGSAAGADKTSGAKGDFSVATGVAAAPLLRELCGRVMKKHPAVKLTVYPIINRFFGESITVAGLVTGRDLREQLKGKALGRALLLPSVMLRHERDKFLDDDTPGALSAFLGVPVRPVDNDGWQLYDAMCGRTL